MLQNNTLYSYLSGFDEVCSRDKISLAEFNKCFSSRNSASVSTHCWIHWFNFTLVNNGTIDPGQTNAWQAISLQDATSFDITNNGTINGPGQMIEFIGNKGTSTITNTGTISTTSHAPITNYGLGFTGSLTIQ